MRIVGQSIWEAGIDYLQNHPNHFLQNCQVGELRMNKLKQVNSWTGLTLRVSWKTVCMQNAESRSKSHISQFTLLFIVEKCFATQKNATFCYEVHFHRFLLLQRNDQKCQPKFTKSPFIAKCAWSTDYQLSWRSLLLWEIEKLKKNRT